MPDDVVLKAGESVTVTADPDGGEPPKDGLDVFNKDDELVVADAKELHFRRGTVNDLGDRRAEYIPPDPGTGASGINVHDDAGGVANDVTDLHMEGFRAIEQTEPGHVRIEAKPPGTGLAGVVVQRNGSTVVPDAEVLDFAGPNWSISRDQQVARVRYMGTGNGEPAGHDAYVNVKKFGAVGDEQTDDREALQAALDAGGGLYFDKRYRCNGPLWLKKNTTILGVGDSRITFHNPAGGIGVDPAAPPLQYLRMDGIELINRTGDGKVILLSTGDLADHGGYPTGPNHSIDFAFISRMKMINGRVKLNSKRDRLWFIGNLLESFSVDLVTYALCCDYGDDGLDTSAEDRVEDGYWISDNNIHARLAPPSTGGFGGDVDLLKFTGKLRRIRLHGNEIICLNGTEVEAQVDCFGAGGAVDIYRNFFKNVVIHHKQNGRHGGRVHIDMFKGGRIDNNRWEWDSGVSGFHHGCAFIRGGGFSSVSGNQVDLDTDARAVQCFTFDNTAPAVGSGWGSGSPVMCDFSRNQIEMRGRDDHLAMQIQGSGQGQPYGFTVHGNIIRCPKTQSIPTVDLGPLEDSSIVGNVDPFGPAWRIPPGCEHAANVWARRR